MSRRKQQQFRRDRSRPPRPPWGWLLVALLLLGALLWLLERGVGSGQRGVVDAGQVPAANTRAAPREPTALPTPTASAVAPVAGTATPPPVTKTPPPAAPSPQLPTTTLHSTGLTRGRLSAFAALPGGEHFAVAAATGVYIFDGSTLAEVRAYPTTTQVLALAVSEGNQGLLLTALTAGGQIYRWLLGTEGAGGTLAGQELDKLTLPLAGAVFSPDGLQVAALVGNERTGREIRFYDPDSGRLRHILPAHNGRAEQVVFLPAAVEGAGPNPLLLTRGDGRVRLWHSTRWRELALPQALARGVTVLAGGRDGASGNPLLAAGHDDGRVTLWNGRTWQLLRAFTPASGAPAQALALSADGSLLAAAAEDGALTVWETGSGERLAGCEESATVHLALLGEGEGARLVTLDDGGLLRSRDARAGCAVDTGGAVARANPDRPFVPQIDFLAAGPGGTVAASGPEGPVYLWDVRAQTVSGLLRPGGPIGALAFSPQGLVAVGGEAGVQLWDAAAGELLHEPGGHVRSRPGKANVVALAFSPAAQGETAGVLASGDRSGLIKLWRGYDGATLRNLLPDEAEPVTSLGFSADGYYLLAGGGAGVRIWQPRRGELLGTVAGAGSAVGAPPRPPEEGRWEMIARLNGPRVELYQEDGRYLRTLQAVPAGAAAEPARVTAAAFLRLPAGEEMNALRLASGHEDGLVRLWDPGQGRLLATLPGHPGEVTALAVVEECLLVSAGTAGTLRVDDLCRP